MATEANPGDGDWYEGEWEAGYARVLLGPGHVELPQGTYWVWISFEAGAEVPTQPAGPLRVY